MLDVAIRHGRIVDGTGLPSYLGDVGILNGRVVSVGSRAAAAREEIDAKDLVIAPGFVDPHTHYDAQLIFDPLATPALEHGVTSVVTGNCSLSMAPLRSGQRDDYSSMFRMIEEMPKETFDQGVDWSWGEGFDGMLDTLRGKVGINVASLVGHSTLRMYVMGDDAGRRAATDAELQTMAQALRTCLDAGAAGLSTSYVDSDADFRPVPSRWAEHREIEMIASVLGEYGRMLQVVPEMYDTSVARARVEMLADLSLRFGIPTTLSPLFYSNAMPAAAGQVMDAVDRAWARGARVWPQVQTRPLDFSFRLGQRSMIWLYFRKWWEITTLAGREEQMRALRDHATRQLLIDEISPAKTKTRPSAPGAGLALGSRSWTVREVQLEHNRKYVGRTLGDIADELGSSVGDVLIDLSLEENLETWFMRAGIGHNDTLHVGELLAHPRVMIGASDEGAHVDSFATYGDTGYLMSQFVRGTGQLSLEEAVQKISRDPARIWGFHGRGELTPGYAADVVIFDPAAIGRGEEIRTDDFPGGGRWVRRSVGVASVLVNGVVAWTAAEGYRAQHAGELLPSSSAG
jgi:N-acyl-D-aspartate/D-glutamate deacylase